MTDETKDICEMTAAATLPGLLNTRVIRQVWWWPRGAQYYIKAIDFVQYEAPYPEVSPSGAATNDVNSMLENQPARIETGWARLEGTENEVVHARRLRSEMVQIAKYNLTARLYWSHLLTTTTFTVDGLEIDIGTFEAVFNEYCRCKNIDHLTSISHANWFIENSEPEPHTGLYTLVNQCKTTCHWLELQEKQFPLHEIYLSDLVELSKHAPTAVAFKEFLTQTEKTFARHRESWFGISEQIKRAHVAYCTHFGVACTFLKTSLTQKPLRRTKTTQFQLIYRAALGKGDYPPGITAKTVGSIKRREHGYTMLQIAAISGHFPPKTSVQDLITCTVQGPRSEPPLYLAAMNGNLDKIAEVNDSHLRQVGALTQARRMTFRCSDIPSETEVVVNNIVGCPELGSALKCHLDNSKGEFCRKQLHAILRHPRLTSDKWARLFKNKNLAPLML